MMQADFHYRDKIPVAVIDQKTERGRLLKQELAAHPWLILAQESDPIGLTIDLTGQSKATPRIVEGIDAIYVPELTPLSSLQSKDCFGLPISASAALSLALNPLQKTFGIKAVRAVVMAGPGVGPNNAGPDPDLGARMEREMGYLFDFVSRDSLSVEAMTLPLSQQVVQCVSVSLLHSPHQIEGCAALREVWKKEQNALWSLGLPSALEKTIRVWESPAGAPISLVQYPSLRVHISRVQICPLFGFKFVVTSHSHRAGILLLAELLVKVGKVYW